MQLIDDRDFYKSCEIIGGKKIMAPSASAYHSRSITRLSTIIDSYVFKNKCGHVFTDSLDLHLPDGNIVRPDLIVITKENSRLVNWNRGIYGVPDMVVEIISRSSKNRDFNVKKDMYESNGVKEYWIIDPFFKSVLVYLLQDDKYFLDNEYIYFEDKEEFEEMPEEDKAQIKSEIALSIFPELTVKLEDIFEFW